MAHNCNHFSQAFCSFLGFDTFPQEIIQQPQEFMGTGIGQLMSGMLGVPKQTSPVLVSEAINPKYSSLYVEYPKLFLASDAELIDAIATISNDYTTNNLLNNALAAYNMG